MKTICIYHSRDLDGWMSAAIVKKWFEGEHPKDALILNAPEGEDKVGYRVSPIETTGANNSLTMLGWDYGDKIPDLSIYDEIIMCDISFPEKEMEERYEIQVKKHGDSFIWIDHHISAIKVNSEAIAGIRDTKLAACELTWKYFFPNKKLPEIVRLLGRYDCFGHKGTDEEQEVLEFQYGARMLISGYNDAYYNLESWLQNDKAVMDAIPLDGAAIYRYLCTEATQTYSKAFPVELKETYISGKRQPGLKLMHKGGLLEYYDRKFLCVNQERFNPINFGIDYHKQGYDGFACFWFNKGKWNFSLYNDNGLVDCSVIAKSFGGGGHKGASGFVVDDLKKIIG